MIWSEWYYSGFPEVGDYIWVEGYYFGVAYKWSHRGLVVKVDSVSAEVVTIPHFPNSAPARRWRKLLSGNEDRNIAMEQELFT